MLFKILLKSPIENQIRYGYTKAVNFITILLKNSYKTMIWWKENFVVAERFIRTLRTKSLQMHDFNIKKCVY